MSKSKGNVITPLGLLREHGSDGVRYWAASGRPGADTAFDPGQMRVGRRLAIKVLNASKFVLAAPDPQGPIASPLDRAMLAKLADLVADTTADLEDYNYARALERTETFFWWFCDNYLELVKSRRYGSQGREPAGSANRTLLVALSVLHRLFAPFLPFVAEEVWSWWQRGSVHAARWPDVGELRAAIGETPADGRALDLACAVLAEVRKAKSDAQQPLRTPVSRARVHDTGERLALLDQVQSDLCAAGYVERLERIEDEAFAVEVELAQASGTQA
jgi:valyl-tRNA synthetase